VAIVETKGKELDQMQDVDIKIKQQIHGIKELLS
jgi:hypothetical protein